MVVRTEMRLLCDGNTYRLEKLREFNFQDAQAFSINFSSKKRLNYGPKIVDGKRSKRVRRPVSTIFLSMLRIFDYC